MTDHIDSRKVDSFAHVLVSGAGNDATRNDIHQVEVHLTKDDPTALRLLVDTAEKVDGFLDALFQKVASTEGVLFSTSDLVRMLMELPETAKIQTQLAQITENEVTYTK